MKTKLHYSIVCALLIALSACSSKLNTSSRQERPKVQMSINLNADNSFDFTDLRPDFYRLKIKDFLNGFVKADLVLVGDDEKADVILDIDVKNFRVYPKKESSFTQEFKRTVPAGTDAKGKPIYETITATVYSEVSSIRSTAKLSSTLTFKDPFYKVPPQNYSADYYWTYSSQIGGGDAQLLGTRLYSGKTQSYIDPVAEELLFQLSNKEMLGRISADLRRYYQKLNN